MTVIFFAQPEGVPVLVGDMLMSGNEDDKSAELILPDHINGVVEAFPEGSGYVPKSMRRKIFVIGRNVAVGVSGSALHMRSFVRDLAEHFGDHEEVTAAEFRSFFDAYKSADHGLNVVNNVGALVLIKEPEQCQFVVVGQKAKESCTEVDTKNFGGAVAIGSGQKMMAEEIKRLDSYGFATAPDMKVVKRVDVALIRTLSLISQLNKLDSLTYRSLLNYWGGGYEVVYCDNENGFQYLDEYSTVFWMLDLEQSEPDLSPLGLMRYHRMEKYSLIYTFDKGKHGAFGAGDVGAVYSIPESVDVRDISFNGGLINNMVLACRENRLQAIYNFVDRYNKEYPGAVFVEVRDDARMQIFIKSGFGAEFARSIVDHQNKMYSG